MSHYFPLVSPPDIRHQRASLRCEAPWWRPETWKGNRMAGNLEQTKRTGASAAWTEASSLVKAEDILTPEELAARLKVPDSWVYEKTRGRCRNPIPCLRLGRYVRFDCTAVATWLTAPAPLETRPARPDLPNRRRRHARSSKASVG
jgi:excisionase family DNA binding protein